jgi:copper chaperone CopZ
MKAIAGILVFLFAISSSFAGGKDIKVSVKGMVCGFCAQGITKKFKDRKEVETIDVSLEKKTVLIKIKEGESLSDGTITEILTNSGYNVEKIER